MSNLLKLLQGHKTYITTGIMLVLGVLQALGKVVVPEYLWPILTALGLGFIKAGSNRVEDVVREISKK